MALRSITLNIEWRISSPSDMEYLKKLVKEFMESYPNATINIRATRR